MNSRTSGYCQEDIKPILKPLEFTYMLLESFILLLIFMYRDDKKKKKKVVCFYLLRLSLLYVKNGLITSKIQIFPHGIAAVFILCIIDQN